MLKWFNGFFMALGMFTIIPTPTRFWADRSMPMILPCLPLIGLVTGGLWILFVLGLRQLTIPPLLLAAAVTVFPYIITGFLHLDGYMDTWDAVLSRRSLEEKRRILKDSTTGAFSVIMLVILMLFAFTAVCAILEDQKSIFLLLPICIFSRSAAAVCLISLPTIAKEGYGHTFKQNVSIPSLLFLICVCAASFVAAWFLNQMQGLGVMAVQAGGFYIFLCWPYRSLKGISGDLAGAALTASELCGLLALAVL